MIDWIKWHEDYDDPGSSRSRRLRVVQRRIREFLNGAPKGQIRILAMCAGDGRDLLGVLNSHPRVHDAVGRLVELDETLARRARESAPHQLEIQCSDAGVSNAYAGACPADLVLSCGVFGNISSEDVRATIASWRFLCAPDATIIWTRAGDAEHDLRPQVRRWVIESGFEELGWDGEPETYGVGVARIAVPPEPFRLGVRMFDFMSDSSAVHPDLPTRRVE